MTKKTFHNPNCCGNKCTSTDGEVKILPTGGGNMVFCKSCFDNEISWRRSRIAQGISYELPTWDELVAHREEGGL